MMEDPTEDIILSELSPAEIALIVDQLEELDPDNELLPAGKLWYEYFWKYYIFNKCNVKTTVTMYFINVSPFGKCI